MTIRFVLFRFYFCFVFYCPNERHIGCSCPVLPIVSNNYSLLVVHMSVYIFFLNIWNVTFFKWNCHFKHFRWTQIWINSIWAVIWKVFKNNSKNVCYVENIYEKIINFKFECNLIILFFCLLLLKSWIGTL